MTDKEFVLTFDPEAFCDKWPLDGETIWWSIYGGDRFLISSAITGEERAWELAKARICQKFLKRLEQ